MISYRFRYQLKSIQRVNIIEWHRYNSKYYKKAMQQSCQILSASKTITIHNLESEATNPIAEYNPHRGIVNCAVYNHTGKVIASCGQDGKIALHSAQKCQDKLLQLTYYSGQQEPSSINSCLFSPKSKYIAAGSVNSTVKVWDMKTSKQKQPIKKLKGHAGAVTSIGWVNNEEIIASGSTSGDILLHDVLTGAIRDSLSSRLQQGINNIKVSEGEGFKRLTACTNSGSVMVWDLNISTKKPIYTYEDPKKSSFTCLSISSFRPIFMACSSIDSNILFMDINQRKVVKLFCTQQPLTSIAFNDDGQMLAAGGMSGKLLIYDLRKIQTPLFRLNGHDTPIKSVCFSQKQKDKEKQKLLKGKEFGVGSNISKTSNNIKQIGQGDVKILTPVLSSNKLLAQQQKNPRIRNLTKKQQINQPIPQERLSTQQTYQQPLLVHKGNLNVVQPAAQTTSQPSSSTNMNPTTTYTTYQRTTPSYQLQSGSTQLAQEMVPQSQLKSVEQKLLGEMKNMEMRMNEKFEALHLQLIRQMQLSVEKMGISFDKKFSQQRQLQNKIKQLQQENENLKKRTY